MPDLSLKSGNRGGGDNDSAVAVGKRLNGLHRGSHKPHHVETADQVDTNDPFVIRKRHGSFATDDAFRRPDASAINENARWSVRRGGLLHGGFTAGAVGDVAGNGHALDAIGHLRRCLLVDIGNCNLGARCSQCARGRGTQARRAAGDDGWVSLDFHQRCPSAAITREDRGTA